MFYATETTNNFDNLGMFSEGPGYPQTRPDVTNVCECPYTIEIDDDDIYWATSTPCT